MASEVNSAHRGRRKFLLLPRRYNRTAVDRCAYGCTGRSADGVSVSLRQTLLRGSAALALGPRRLRGRNPTPEKLIRTPTPACQNAGLGPGGRPSSVLAQREGSHTASVQESPLGSSRHRRACRGLIPAAGAGASASARAQGSKSQHTPARDARPWLAPVRQIAPRHGPVFPRRRRSVAESSRGRPPPPSRVATRRRTAGRRRPPACAAGGRRPGPAGPPAPPGPGPCRASSPGEPATSGPARWHAAADRWPPRRPT